MLHSIRTRLTITFLGLAVVPILIIGLLLSLRIYSVQTHDAIELQREMAEHLSSRVQSLIGSLEKEMQMLIRFEDLLNMRQEKQKLVLSIFHSRQSAIEDLILLDADGRILSYFSRLKLQQNWPQYLQKNLKSIKDPLSRNETYFGPVHIQEISGEPLMIMAIPIIGLYTGKLEGILIADIRLKEIWDLVARIRPGKNGISFIVDAGNKVIAHSNPSIVLRGTRFDLPGFDGVQKGLSGKISVLVSRRISFGDQQFHIFVEGPFSEALALGIHTVRIMLTIVLITLLIAGILGFLTVRQIVRPIEDIAESARAINMGDLSRRVVVKRNDELGILADTFNNMTIQLEILINDLEQRVDERTAELAASNKELEAFAYSVSHDLRAPLRHIDSFLKLLQKRTAGSFDARNQHYVEIIADETERMGMLIDDLLAFSRFGRCDLSKVPVDLNILLNDVIQELEPDTAGRDIHWNISELPVITGDRAMLRIVLVNLLSNAVKFTSTREIAEIKISLMEGQDSETIVYVSDNGVGFDPAYIDKLFGVFQRLHHSDEFDGTGVGLAIAQRIIHRHGGKIWAEGEYDKGAVFYFSLPAKMKES